MKKEARIARIEGLPGGGVLIIVFRGGWIDGVSAFPHGSAAALGKSRYAEELRGISLGEGLKGEDAAGLKSWASARGLPEVEVGERNRRQARAIAQGFRGLLEGKD